MSSLEFIDFCNSELDPGDFDILKKIYLFSDIKNALNYEDADYTFISPACYSETDFKENLKDTDTFIPFMAEYFYNKKQERRNFSDLMEIDEAVLLFYTHINTLENNFLKDYFHFELDLQNVTTRLSLRMNDVNDPNKIIPYGDNFEQIRKNSSADLGLTQPLRFIEELVEVYEDGHLVKIEQKIEEIRWKWVEERVGYQQFSLDNILAYAIQLNSVERWINLTEEKGETVLNNLISEITDNIKL